MPLRVLALVIKYEYLHLQLPVMLFSNIYVLFSQLLRCFLDFCFRQENEEKRDEILCIKVSMDSLSSSPLIYKIVRAWRNLLNTTSVRLELCAHSLSVFVVCVKKLYAVGYP